MPKMGESIIEATVLSWAKSVGDSVAVDETVLEIATDKVDSEVPSPVAGTITEIRFEPDAVVPVGEVIAVIETEGAADARPSNGAPAPAAEPAPAPTERDGERAPEAEVLSAVSAPLGSGESVGAGVPRVGSEGQFFSPLVRRIAEAEGISQAELESIPGSGRDGRVNKQDVLDYLARRGAGDAAAAGGPILAAAPARTTTAAGGGDEIVEMDRMRRLIADHMVSSVRTSPHVTSFVEADVTDLVNWRQAHKVAFEQRHGERITFTPIFVEAVTRAIVDFPGVNVQVDGHRIIRKRDINVGMAAALPSGNLIVPVIKRADRLSLAGLAAAVNDLTRRARANQLAPGDIQDGTFTLTNVGTFGTVMGTPIINQPQVAILAVGAIRKRPAVLETEHGDVIAIRHMMFLSLSYDHRVVDGMLGGSFLRRGADNLEGFDINRVA